MIGVSSHWWDKLGEPQYGGEIVIRANRNIVNFDPYFNEGLTSVQGAWMERLVSDDWTVNPAIFDFKTGWHPSQYMKGLIEESWEFINPNTYVAHLHKGIHWQDIPPANGREFIADDVVFHFNRLFGLGGGFTKPSPFHTTPPAFKELISVTAADKYTVVFKWRVPNAEFILDALHNFNLALCLENPDAVKLWGDVSDWHHAIGTGPFILKDFVPDCSATLVKNTNYWGFDERYPQNKLPYIDKLKFLIIPDDDTALEAMLAGKIDVLNGISPMQAQSIKKTNPEILQIPTPASPTITVQPRNDRVPFNDIRVRKAMQIAIDLPTIAKSYYKGTVDPYPSTITSNYVKGWGFPYEEWPQDLKDEYAYNPTLAKELLTDAGYPDGFKTNIVADTAGDMDLLQIIKSYFSQVGIEMEIRSMESNDWINFVITARKHDQLVYRPYGPLGHAKAPIRVITQFQTGALHNYLMVNDPVFDAFRVKALETNNLDDVLRILKDANERVARQHFAISLLQPMSYSLCQPRLKGFNGQIHSTWMGSGGPSLVGFYVARFWIDQHLKNIENNRS